MNPLQLVFMGFGAVARSLVTIMLHLDTQIKNLPVLIIDQKNIENSETFVNYRQYAEKNNIQFTYIQTKIEQNNYIRIFDKYIKNNAIVVDMSYRIDTFDIIVECQKKTCLYINTAIDEWIHTPISLFNLKKKIYNRLHEINMNNTTAVINHGMNPGIVSHFLKFLLKLLSKQRNDKSLMNMCDSNQYNHVANKLGLTLVQISERDNQRTLNNSTENLFCNTWSVVGLLDEASLRAEISWGTHEKKIPINSDMSQFTDSQQIILPLHGNQLRTYSYEPEGGILTGYCIPHAECYSIVNFLKISDQNGSILYAPSVYYSYLIPDTAKLITHFMDFCVDEHGLPSNEHVLRSDEIIDGYDSVGCLAHFNNGKKYWIGSIMDHNIAKKYSPEINVTCIQVGISVISCIEWMIMHPNLGILEPEDIDSSFILTYCKDWLGKLYCADVTNKCTLSDQFSELVSFPNNLEYK